MSIKYALKSIKKTIAFTSLKTNHMITYNNTKDDMNVEIVTKSLGPTLIAKSNSMSSFNFEGGSKNLSDSSSEHIYETDDALSMSNVFH